MYSNNDSVLVSADFNRWCKADLWEVQEGVCLLLGIEPKLGMFVNRSRYQYGNDGFWHQFDEITDAAKRSVQVGSLKIHSSVPNELSCKVLPLIFLRWASAKNLPMPDQLMQMLQDAENEERVSETNSKAPRNSHIVKAACQAVALTLWDINPNMTIEEMKTHPGILKHAGGLYYSGKNTLRDWLSEVDPRPADKKTGRPKIPVNSD